MFKVEKVDDHNKQQVIDSLKSDVVRHAFALYDLQHESEYTTMYVASENDNIKGYTLTYSKLEPPSVIMECESNVAEKLIEKAPPDNFIMHTTPKLLRTAKRKYPTAKHYVEDWMLIRKGEARPFPPEHTRRLSTENDASKLATLLENRKDHNTASMRRYHDWISKMPLYGVFIDSRLIACAGSFVQLPQVWIIGGVYTHPKHRNKGYATLATSAITEEALKNAETAALFVRSDNYPAIKAYEKIGYKKIGEKLWIDVGTGLKP
jgi:RimJ/RimL family protein N-acetyltransferase